MKSKDFKLDKRFIVNLQGKEFVTYEGLLDLAHQIGIKSIETDLIQIPNKNNSMMAIMRATVTTKEDEVFSGYGDASPENVNRNIAKHSIRMAETRAKARALRDLTNIGMTAIEEVIEEDVINSNKATQKQLDWIFNLAKTKEVVDEMPGLIKDMFDKDSSKELSTTEASKIIKKLQDM